MAEETRLGGPRDCEKSIVSLCADPSVLFLATPSADLFGMPSEETLSPLQRQRNLRCLSSKLKNISGSGIGGGVVLDVRTGWEWAQSDQKLITHLSGLGPQGCNSGPK